MSSLSDWGGMIQSKMEENGRARHWKGIFGKDVVVDIIEECTENADSKDLYCFKWHKSEFMVSESSIENTAKKTQDWREGYSAFKKFRTSLPLQHLINSSNGGCPSCKNYIRGTYGYPVMFRNQ